MKILPALFYLTRSFSDVKFNFESGGFMREESDLKIFIRYVSLNIMSMIGLSCYILADTYYVANGLGADGLAALNLSIPVFSFITGAGLMLGIGGGTRFAVLKAQEKHDEAESVFMNMVYGAAFFALIYIFLGIFFPGKIAELMGADQYTFERTETYIRIILVFSPAFLMNNILNSFVKNDGSPHIAMIASVSGSIFNIIFDYIFIFPMGMGMKGAALATGTAPLAGLLVLSLHFIRKKNTFNFIKIKLIPEYFGICLPLGVPSLVTELSSGIVIIIFNILIMNISGNTGIAAYGIIANISLVVISVYTGIAQGIQPVVSNAYGKENRKRIKRVFNYAVRLSLLISVCIYLFLFIKTDMVVSLFNGENRMDLAEIAGTGIRLYFTAIPFAGLNIVMCSYFASVENKIPAQFISFARGFIIIIPVVFIMSFMAGLEGIWLSFPLTEIATFIFAAIYLRKSKSVIR